MKILLVYASAGAGHLKAAQSLFEYLRTKDQSLDVKLVDVLDYCHPLFSGVYAKSYDFFVRYASWAWLLLYYITKIAGIGRLIRMACYPVNRLSAGSFIRLAEKEAPDIFISTHFLASELISGIKIKNGLRRKLVSVITDFSVHPFWISENTGLYAVASDASACQLMRYGVDPGKIAVTGIPVDPQFAEEKSGKEFLKNSGLDPQLFTVCIVSGSFGIGPIEGIIESLKNEAQLLAVTANNKRLFLKLASKGYPRVRIFGFIDNMSEVIRACDIVLTKPGGLTIAELLAAEKPFIFIAAIPGQERENMRILGEYGIGDYFHDVAAIKKAVLACKRDAGYKSAITEKIKKIKKPFACSQIYELICKNSYGAGG